MADLFSVSASGMEAQRFRMNIIASNLANVETTRTESGGAYRRKDIVFAAQGEGGFGSVLQKAMDSAAPGVKVAGVIEDARPLKQVYEPAHPDADANGYVAFPNINVAEEMVNMIAASRSYEANVSAFKATREMALKALEIGQ
ncbi:MAG: flagellar basal body rod protein FlgC [Deltaproteobacteria bacterium]|jgi:flagellar basal-body rod protein FlgC|nr:flagellar basal body rod protein FlgC [Deltaproteobacteria bacterium]